MKRVKAYWKALIAALALALAAGWYCRPADIYGLGIGDLAAINIRISCADPGQGNKEARSIGLLPGDPLWQDILEEAEGLRFRRHLGNLVRQYQEGVIHTEAAAKETVTFYLWDSSGGTLMLQLSSGRISYTSRHTGRNLPASLSGGEKAVQALIERLRPLLPEES